MLRVAVLALVLFAVCPAAARAQSFAQLSGEAGCLLQTGVDLDETNFEFGAPTACGRAPGLISARAAVVSPDQRNLYVTSGGGIVDSSNGVVTFDRDGSTGALAVRGCVTATGGDGRVGTDGLCARADSLRGASDLALSPDGRFAYVAASGSNGVSWFERDGQTGALTPRGCLKHTFGFGERCIPGYALDGAGAIAVSPDGKHVYVAASRSNSVVAFARDDTTGALTELSCVSDTGSDGQCADGTALAGADGVTVSGDGADVYVTSSLAGSVTGYRRDAATGALTPHGCLLAKAPEGGPCASVPALAGAADGELSGDGRNLYVAATDYDAEVSTLVTLARDPATGTLTGAGCLQHRPPTRDEFTGDPDEYYYDEDEVDLVPGCTGARALDGARAVAVAADGRAVFAAGGYSLTAFGRDPATGALTQFGCVEPEPEYKSCSAGRAIEFPAGLAASADGRSLYAVSSASDSLAVFAATVAIVSSRARVSRRGAIRVRLACPRVALRTCAGDVRVAGARAVRYRLAAGASNVLTLRMPHGRRRAAVVVARAAGVQEVRRSVALT